MDATAASPFCSIQRDGCTAAYTGPGVELDHATLLRSAAPLAALLGPEPLDLAYVEVEVLGVPPAPAVLAASAAASGSAAAAAAGGSIGRAASKISIGLAPADAVPVLPLQSQQRSIYWEPGSGGITRNLPSSGAGPACSASRCGSRPTGAVPSVTLLPPHREPIPTTTQSVLRLSTEEAGLRVGDVIGLAWSPLTQRAYFTFNGEWVQKAKEVTSHHADEASFLASVASCGLPDQLVRYVFPAVSMHRRGEAVRLRLPGKHKRGGTTPCASHHDGFMFATGGSGTGDATRSGRPACTAPFSQQASVCDKNKGLAESGTSCRATQALTLAMARLLPPGVPWSGSPAAASRHPDLAARAAITLFALPVRAASHDRATGSSQDAPMPASLPDAGCCCLRPPLRGVLGGLEAANPHRRAKMRDKQRKQEVAAAAACALLHQKLSVSQSLVSRPPTTEDAEAGAALAGPVSTEPDAACNVHANPHAKISSRSPLTLLASEAIVLRAMRWCRALEAQGLLPAASSPIKAEVVEEVPRPLQTACQLFGYEKQTEQIERLWKGHAQSVLNLSRRLLAQLRIQALFSGSDAAAASEQLQQRSPQLQQALLLALARMLDVQ